MKHYQYMISLLTINLIRRQFKTSSQILIVNTDLQTVPIFLNYSKTGLFTDGYVRLRIKHHVINIL